MPRCFSSSILAYEDMAVAAVAAREMHVPVGVELNGGGFTQDAANRSV